MIMWTLVLMVRLGDGGSMTTVTGFHSEKTCQAAAAAWSIAAHQNPTSATVCLVVN